MKLGDAFLMGSPGGSTKHLWILISNPAAHNGHGVIVNLTTNRERSGGECRLGVGDHQWLTSECWASFADAKLIAPDQWCNIQSGIRQGTGLSPGHGRTPEARKRGTIKAKVLQLGPAPAEEIHRQAQALAENAPRTKLTTFTLKPATISPVGVDGVGTVGPK
jgi:hypothetical protein